MQIKRASAYPGTSCSLPMEWGRGRVGGGGVEVVNSFMGTKRETAKGKRSLCKELIERLEMFYFMRERQLRGGMGGKPVM